MQIIFKSGFTIFKSEFTIFKSDLRFLNYQQRVTIRSELVFFLKRGLVGLLH